MGASVERKRDDSGGFDLNIWKRGGEIRSGVQGVDIVS